MSNMVATQPSGLNRTLSSTYLRWRPAASSSPAVLIFPSLYSISQTWRHYPNHTSCPDNTNTQTSDHKTPTTTIHQPKLNLSLAARKHGQQMTTHGRLDPGETYSAHLAYQLYGGSS